LLIPANSSVFINIGTTTEVVARPPLNQDGMRFITNHLNVASLLANSAALKVIVTGGEVRSSKRASTCRLHRLNGRDA
jgi:DeoR family glycerol-3-phosphate regulon repressor